MGDGDSELVMGQVMGINDEWMTRGEKSGDGVRGAGTQCAN